jgi:hypothetical protein
MNKLILTLSLMVAVTTMITPNQFSIYTSPTTEDDGYTYPDDATEEEKEKIDEREQEAWEDAGRPGEIDDDNDDDNDDEEIPYCDEVGSGYQGTCFDSQDYDDVTGLAPCKDGSQVPDYKDCPDREEQQYPKIL